MKLTNSASTWAARLSIAALALATPLGAQNLVTNPGFETGNFSGWNQSGNLGFTSVACGIGVQHSGNCAAQLGPIGSNGYLLQQILATQAGHVYDVNFWLAHPFTDVAPQAQFNAYWNGVIFYSSLGGYFDYTNPTTLMTALFPGTVLTFEFRDDPAFWYLDDVNVSDIASTVPEPTSIVLLGSGLVGLAGIVRRRRAVL